MSVARKSMLKDSKAFSSCKVRRAFAAPVITGRFDLLRIKLCASQSKEPGIFGERGMRKGRRYQSDESKSDAAIRLRRL